MLLVNNTLQQMLKKVMSSLDVLFWHLPGETTEYHVNMSGQLVSTPRIELGPFQIQVTSTTF